MNVYKMDRKVLLVLLCGFFPFLNSCVDRKYDLIGKDVSTDVKIEGNKVTLPFGSLNAVTLDSIIDTDDVDILDKGDNGMYCISIDDSISPVEVNVDPVKINIESQSHKIEVDFEDVDIDTVHVEKKEIDPMSFDAPEISLQDLNENLPVLQSEVTTSIATAEIKQLLETLKDNPDLRFEQPIDVTVGTGTQNVDCSFNYTLPDDVETITNIQLATSGDEKSPNGTLVNVVVENSAMLGSLDKKIDFKITFPEYFVLYTDKYSLSAGKNEIMASGISLEGERNVISFYIKEIKDVDKRIKNGVIDIADEVTYSLDYYVSGELEITSGITLEDLDFNVQFDVPLAFKDVKGKTKEIKVDFESITMDFTGHFDDLEYVDTIYYIDFDAQHSKLKFESLMDTTWFGEFKLKDGYALKIEFPEELSISDKYSEYNGKGTSIKYSASEHSLYVYDLKALANNHWAMALEKYTAYKPVFNKECDIDFSAGIYFVDEKGNRVDHLILAGVELNSMAATLNMLKGKKSAEFNMSETDLIINDVKVHATGIKSDLDTSTDFTINEEVPGDIGRLEKLDFTEDVAMRFNIAVSGLDDLDADVHLDLYAVLPSFLKLSKSNSASDVDIVLRGDSLFFVADVNPRKDPHLSFELQCDSLYFLTEEFGNSGMMPKDSTDGKTYISYDGEINIVGKASIEEVELRSDILEKLNDIEFDIDVDIDEIEVKMFHGVYRGEIDEVTESFELDLGDELDFLKEDGNTVTLAEPQIEILLDNSICVPIDVDMQIFGRDDNGEIIPSSLLTERVSVLPAKYDEKTGKVTPVETKLFLTSDSNMVSKVGYKNVQIPDLKRLLEKVPNTIDFNIKPLVNTSRTHHVDISKPLTFTGSYNVYIPLKFDNLNIEYTDSITDLADDFGENLDMLTNIAINARMNVVNTIPVVLCLNIKAIDINDKVMEDIEIEPVIIKAGNGGAIKGTSQEAQDVTFLINSKTGDFSTLDKLLLTVEAVSDHATGPVGLQSEQGILVTDIVFEITGDIETDLSE